MFKERIAALQSQLNREEAVLITSGPNRRYYTGFPSSAGLVVVTQNSARFLIDFRYYEKAKNTVDAAEVMLLEKTYDQLRAVFTEQKIKTVFTETEEISVARLSALRNALPEVAFSDDETMQKFILRQRSIKSVREIENIAAAQRLTDQTFAYICERIAAGRTEKEIMLDMEFFIRKAGSEGVAFDFIVISGKNTSLPHGVPTDKKVETGDFITMDFGAVVNGYRSDMTRTVALGNVTEEQQRVYETVLAAQEKALAFIGPGKKCRDVDKVARDLITDAGFDGCFGHGLGHSVGLEIHEDPACNTRCETVLQEGVVMTVEPGIYLENRFGVRIEDMVVIRKNGCQNLTASPKNLILL